MNENDSEQMAFNIFVLWPLCADLKLFTLYDFQVICTQFTPNAHIFLLRMCACGRELEKHLLSLLSIKIESLILGYVSGLGVFFY